MSLLTEKIEPHVAALMIDAHAFDAHARIAIALYELHTRFPSDSVISELCDAVLERWLAGRSPPVERGESMISATQDHTDTNLMAAGSKRSGPCSAGREVRYD